MPDRERAEEVAEEHRHLSGQPGVAGGAQVADDGQGTHHRRARHDDGVTGEGCHRPGEGQQRVGPYARGARAAHALAPLAFQPDEQPDPERGQDARDRGRGDLHRAIPPPVWTRRTDR